MLFNSIDFALFLPVVFLLYWFVAKKSLPLQNLLLLAASYFFYACWDWRFLILLVFISVLNYSIGLGLQRAGAPAVRKTWLIAGLAANIGMLAWFKYFHFFVDGFVRLVALTGLTVPQPTLHVILPLGISFYVFLSLSYIIDVYRHNLEGGGPLTDVLLALSFFPIILAGPIQRPRTLLPQIRGKRVFDYASATDGLRRILWGLFMKVVIADRCGVPVQDIFRDFQVLPGSTLLLGGILYTVQIYADFAGYSLIAVGVAKLFGFDLMQNFAYPYFSRNMKEFWQRWHISLTSWFRDYLFLPISYALGRRVRSESGRVGFINTELLIYIVGISLTWLLVGLWHGGNLTFIVWGLANGLLLIAYQIGKKPRKRLLKSLKIGEGNIVLVGAERVATLLIIIGSWIVFRADSLGLAAGYLGRMVSKTIVNRPAVLETSLRAMYGKEIRGNPSVTITIALVGAFFLIEWLGRNQDYALAGLGTIRHRALRYAVYYAIILAILWFGGSGQHFIYFQF